MDYTKLVGDTAIQISVLLVAIVWCVKQLFSTVTSTYGKIIDALHAEMATIRQDAINDRKNCEVEIASLKSRIANLENQQQPHAPVIINQTQK